MAKEGNKSLTIKNLKKKAALSALSTNVDSKAEGKSSFDSKDVDGLIDGNYNNTNYSDEKGTRDYDNDEKKSYK
jgi:hypothetical protein